MLNPVFQGALLITASELMFVSMGASIKLLSEMQLSTEMVVFARNAMGLMLVLPLLIKTGGWQNWKTSVPHLHLLRAAMGVGAMYCFFYALANIPLADGMLLKMTSPLFMPLIAYFWLREIAPRLSQWAVPVGFLGVAIVIRPEGETNWIALIGVMGGFLAAIAKVTVRRLSQTEPTLRIVFYFAVFGGLISLVPLTWAWQTPPPETWIWLLAMGAFGTAGQLLMTQGYRMASNARVGPFTYFSVVFGAIYGYVFWQETLSWHFVGGALLIAMAGVMTLQKSSVKA